MEGEGGGKDRSNMEGGSIFIEYEPTLSFSLANKKKLS